MMMNPDKTQKLFIALLAAGLLITGAAVYVLSQQVSELKNRQTQVTNEPVKAPVGEKPTTTDRRVVTLAEVGARIYDFIAMEEAGDWNTQYLLSKLESEPMYIADSTLHIPYDLSWGNDRYQIDTFEESSGEYYFGPMYVGEFGGATRPGSARETKGRTLDAAMTDPSYTSVGCSGDKTFKPAKVKVGNVQTVRFEGEACEATWVGYEIRIKDKNVILTASPAAEEDLVLWVLNRM